jgi:hypothetical protein
VEGEEVGYVEVIGRSVGDQEGTVVVGDMDGILVGMTVGILDGNRDGGFVLTTDGARVEGFLEGIRLGFDVLGAREMGEEVLERKGGKVPSLTG